MGTHGFNIKLSFGTAVDEGYCMVLKPEDSEESLADSIGSLTVANKVFTFANDSFPVNAIARMSPESALLMQTCDDVRSDAINNTEDILASIDVDHDMKITKEEFFSSHGNLSNSEEALDFILSLVTQPEILGKPSNELPSIELGQFFHINWGWREFLKTEGDIAYPWRSILENTIGPLGNNSPTSRVTAFKRANAILSNLIIELRNQRRYPSKVEMEEKLLNCETNDRHSQQISDCADRVFLSDSGGSSYIPVGPGDGYAASMIGESIFDTPLAYPSNYKPGSDFYKSKLLKVASCLINQERSLSLSDLGCEAIQTAPTNAPTMSCAVEDEKSFQCNGDMEAKEKCCPGLVCHEYQWWRCVKEENKSCAGPGTFAVECGSKWNKATPQCCPGLVWGANRRCVLPPSGLFQSSSHTSSNLPTSSPTILSSVPTSSPTSLSFNDVRYRIGNNN